MNDSGESNSIGVSLRSVEFASVPVSEATEWTFAIITNEDGLTGLSEITTGAHTENAVDRVTEYVSALSGKSIPNEQALHGLLGITVNEAQASRPIATALSAVRSAIIEIEAIRRNDPLGQILNNRTVESVELYANVNRALLKKERSPTAFATVAERAVRGGFCTVKCAPFDEVNGAYRPNEILEIARPGLERVRAIRDAIGPATRLFVDCHSRFQIDTAPMIAEELVKSNIGWFEEPVEPTKDLDGLAEIASVVSMPVAGGENGYGEDFYASLIEHGSVSTVMPDIKYCGGAGEAVRTGLRVRGLGGSTSLHSPSGPVSLLAGAHVTGAIPGAMPLEHAVHETEWRAEILDPPEHVENGRLWLPLGPGLGASLNFDAIIRHGGRRWKP